MNDASRMRRRDRLDHAEQNGEARRRVECPATQEQRAQRLAVETPITMNGTPASVSRTAETFTTFG